jgi:predicted transcriptional regulator
MALSQSEIANHLDLSQKGVSQFLEQAGIDWRTATLTDIRVAYITKLRAQAAGHRSEDGLDLVRERVLTERVDREMKQFTLAEKKGTLINVAQLENELKQMVGAFKSELTSRDGSLKDALDAAYGIDVDIKILNVHTHAAFVHLARYDPGGQTVAEAASDTANPAG